MKALVIDVSKCNGCHNCQIACKDEHVGNDWSPYAKPQPLSGHFWIKVTDIVRGTFPKVKVAYKHDICQHCADAPCIPACKQKAIIQRDDGIVFIKPDQCSGDRNCVAACPYGVIYFNENLNISQKCTFCAHLLDNAVKEPRCVDVCPTGALTFGEEEELKSLIDKAEVMEPPGLRTKPRVFYIALPKRFVAGAVFDPAADECIEGASVTLTSREDGAKFTTSTDEFGDFWFEGLKVGSYSLSVEQEGYKPCRIESLSTEQDVNLGDIGLTSMNEEGSRAGLEE
jgi:tetrathionate reductase subunit B